MKIKSLSIKNNRTGWNVENVQFGPLTLLVGASGVGKTQILRALMRISHIARGKSYNGLEWSVMFTQDNHDYVWSGAFETVDVEVETHVTEEFAFDIEWENLSKDEVALIDRQKDKLVFDGHETVKLDVHKSAIELLKQESVITPVYKGFERLYAMQTEILRVRISPVMQEHVKQITLEDVKHSFAMSPIEKLFLLKKNNLSAFDDIVSSFKDIFTTVDEVDFTIGKYFDDRTFPILQIKEKGSDSWVLQSEISSGMYRTLVMIITLNMAEDGDVIIVDEFENGLGVNCINQLADMVLQPEANVQFIMTSHHPYIINVIPYSSWKIVTRKKNTVKVYTAANLNVGEHSKHDAFMQLIQTSAYKTGEA